MQQSQCTYGMIVCGLAAGVSVLQLIFGCCPLVAIRMLALHSVMLCCPKNKLKRIGFILLVLAGVLQELRQGWPPHLVAGGSPTLHAASTQRTGPADSTAGLGKAVKFKEEALHRPRVHTEPDQLLCSPQREPQHLDGV